MADSRIDDLRRRLERDPGSRLFAQLAEELRKGGDLEEAIDVARAGLALHPTYPSARLTLGRALLDSGDPRAARVELEAAVKGAPDNILANRLLGEALESLGDLASALAQYKATLSVAPEDRNVSAKVQAIEASLKAGGERARTAGAASEATPSIRRVPPPLPPAGRAPAPPEASGGDERGDSQGVVPMIRVRARGEPPLPSTAASGGPGESGGSESTVPPTLPPEAATGSADPTVPRPAAAVEPAPPGGPARSPQPRVSPAEEPSRPVATDEPRGEQARGLTTGVGGSEAGQERRGRIEGDAEGQPAVAAPKWPPDGRLAPRWGPAGPGGRDDVVSGGTEGRGGERPASMGPRDAAVFRSGPLTSGGASPSEASAPPAATAGTGPVSPAPPPAAPVAPPEAPAAASAAATTPAPMRPPVPAPVSPPPPAPAQPPAASLRAPQPVAATPAPGFTPVSAESPPPEPPPPAPATPPERPAPAPAFTRAPAATDRKAAPSAEAPGTPLSSVTLAELYFQQGLMERAVEVYRQVLDEEPGNARARVRLEEVEALVVAGSAELTTPAPSAEDGREARRRALGGAIERLEGLLAAVRRR